MAEALEYQDNLNSISSAENNNDTTDVDINRTVTLDQLNIIPDSLILVKQTKKHLILCTPEVSYGLKTLHLECTNITDTDNLI